MRLRGPDLVKEPRNAELVRLLRADARATVSELARRVGLSAPAVRERLQRLEEAGVIARYRIESDPAALGFPIGVLIRMRPMPGKVAKVAELAESLPEVVECHRITGEDCYYIKAHIAALDRLDALQERFAAYGQTTTAIIQSSPVPPRDLPLPEASATRPASR